MIEQYYKDNLPALLKRIKARGMQEADAEDVVHEAFARALKYQRSFNGSEEEIGKWFNTILNNTFKGYRHANFTGDFSFVEEEHMEEYDDADETWTNKDIILKVKEEVSGLKKEHRDIIELVILNGFRYKEASHILDENVENIKKVVFRFKKNMKEKFNDL